MAAVLEVWVTRAGAACRVDDQFWRVDVFDAHSNAYGWAGEVYTNMPAPHGHWAGAIPPGIYVVRARRDKPAKGEAKVTEFAVVDVGCDGHACVRLFVRPSRDDPRQDDPRQQEPGKQEPREDKRPDDKPPRRGKPRRDIV